MNSYTSYQIGAKIPESTHTYSKSEINSGIIEIHSPAIARVLDKWADELSEKFINCEK